MNEEELKNSHPLKELVYSEKRYKTICAGKPGERKKFIYVFGQAQRFNIGGCSVNVYAFAGMDGKGRITILPVFFYTGLADDTPWVYILKDIAEYGDFERLILAVYDNELKTALETVMSGATLYSNVYGLSREAVFKDVLETVCREFETKLRTYWWKCGAITVMSFSEAVTIAEKSIEEIRVYFESIKTEETTVKTVETKAVTETAQTVITALKPKAAGAAWTGEPNYCFVMDKYFYLNNVYIRMAIFTQITDGKFVKSVFACKPEKIALADWEEIIPKAFGKFDPVKYLLFRNCSNLYGINKGILPDVVWCDSIADIPWTESSRAGALKAFNDMENHLASVSKDPEAMKEHLGKIGITNFEIV